MRVSLVVLNRLQRNRIFCTSDDDLNRDGCLEQYAALQRRFQELGASIATQDIIAPRTADAVIYHNVPRTPPPVAEYGRCYLFFLESPIIRPRNFSVKLHEPFIKIFTNADAFVDEKRYFKVNYSFVLPNTVPLLPMKGRKLCTMIAANKTSSRRGELYTERLRAVRWFERRHPESFDLFGQGWNEMPTTGTLGKVARRMPPNLRRVLAQRRPSYKGTVRSKHETLRGYRFAIAYENVAGSAGHITEKIFDCMFAGCIPVYLGAPNIADHVDPDCYLDKRAYSDYRDLYEHMVGFTEAEYRRRIDAIRTYLHSEASAQFSVEWFARTVAGHVIEDNITT